MRARVLVASTAVLVAATMGCSSGTSVEEARDEAPEVSADDVVLVRGREVYVTQCARCHGTQGQGDIGPVLAGGRTVERFPDPADEFELIANGRNRMPRFGNLLTDDEISAVVTYTREAL